MGPKIFLFDAKRSDWVIKGKKTKGKTILKYILTIRLFGGIICLKKICGPMVRIREKI